MYGLGPKSHRQSRFSEALHESLHAKPRSFPTLIEFPHVFLCAIVGYSS